MVLLLNKPVWFCFPDSSAIKESACNAGDPGSIPALGRSPGEGKGYPLQYPGLGHELYSPWDHKELGTTERLSLSKFIYKNSTGRFWLINLSLMTSELKHGPGQ